jgi:signal peptidase II
VAVALAVLDQLTKTIVCQQLTVGDQIVILSGCFHLVHLRNTGAAWSILRGQTVFLSLLSVVVIGVIALRFRQFTEGRPGRGVSLALIAGGILGNLVDRVARGEVVDFLLFFYRSYHWPAFNLADSAICCGVVLFLALSWFDGGAHGSNRATHHGPT